MASRLLWASRAASYLRISAFHRGFSTVIKDLKYADTHEWVKVDGSSATIGITDHAQDHLGDVVYVELPEVGATVAQGKNFGAVESVKATSDVNSPISGEVVEVNSELVGSPGLVYIRLAEALSSRARDCLLMMDPLPIHRSQDHVTFLCAGLVLTLVESVHGYLGSKVNGSPYENGWIIKVKLSDAGELNSLMDSNQYSKFCEEEDAKH